VAEWRIRALASTKAFGRADIREQGLAPTQTPAYPRQKNPQTGVLGKKSAEKRRKWSLFVSICPSWADASKETPKVDK